ncbi:MAG TPA: hypothetical protein VJT73_20475 [Polyangiaceae bacterium]|nr:hypothetical protein [Polyangiaceae bacterium]
MRTRTVTDGSRSVCYLAFFWSCSVCGHAWTDDRLEDQNASAALEARLAARRAS